MYPQNVDLVDALLQSKKTNSAPGGSSSCDADDFCEYLASTRWLPSTALIRLLVHRPSVDADCSSVAPSCGASVSTPGWCTDGPTIIEYDCAASIHSKIRVSAQRQLKCRHVVNGNDILQLQSVSKNIATALLTTKRNIERIYRCGIFSLWKLKPSGPFIQLKFLSVVSTRSILAFPPWRSYGETDPFIGEVQGFFFCGENQRWLKSLAVFFSIRPTLSPPKRHTNPVKGINEERSGIKVQETVWKLEERTCPSRADK